MLVLRDYIVSYSAMYSIRSCPGMQLKQNIFSANPSINYSRNADAKLTAKTKPSPKPKHLSPTFHLFFFLPFPLSEPQSSPLSPSLCQAPNLHRHWPVKRSPLACFITRIRSPPLRRKSQGEGGARRPTSNVDVRSPSPSVVSKFGGACLCFRAFMVSFRHSRLWHPPVVEKNS